MGKYISKSVLVAEIERIKKEECPIDTYEGRNKLFYFERFLSFLNTLEVKEMDNMPNIRFPHYKNIVEKVFGAGNLESWEYSEAEMLVSLAKEELLKDIEVKEVDFHKELLSFYRHTNDSGSNIALAKHFFELGMRVNNPITAADRGTAEEIIINLKRVEQDYHINLTREIEWLRSKVKKGEDV